MRSRSQKTTRGAWWAFGTGQCGLRQGILAGEACVREVAAFIVDRAHMHGVPATALVEAQHPSLCYLDGKDSCSAGDGSDSVSGSYVDSTASASASTSRPFRAPKVCSLQEFVPHDDVVSDISPSQFPLAEIQKVVVLDIRIVNTDRNDANILVRRVRREVSSSSGGSVAARAVVIIVAAKAVPPIVLVLGCAKQ